MTLQAQLVEPEDGVLEDRRAPRNRVPRMDRAVDGPPIRDDAGSTLLLTIFYAFLSLVLILMVTSASSLYLERKRLFTLADGAALAGAEAFELSAVAPTDGGLGLVLDSTAVDDSVERFIATVDDGSLDDLTVEQAIASDSRSATVTLSSYWRPPLASLLVPEGVRLEVTTTARSIFF